MDQLLKNKLEKLYEVLSEFKKGVLIGNPTSGGGTVDAAPTSGGSVMQSEGGPEMASPSDSDKQPEGLKNKRKPVTHDECGRPFAKDETDDKIKAKLRAEMDRRNFGEADATRHIIDRDRGAKQPAKPKPLLQSELVKALDDAGHRESALLLKNWGEEDSVAKAMREELTKSNYGPKDLDLYDKAANQKRKESRTGEEVEGAGKNKGVRRYTSAKMGSAKQQAAAQAKVDAAKNKAQPVKTYSPEELEAFAAERGTKVSKDENTLDYSKINQKPKIDEAKAPKIDYSDRASPKVTRPWKTSDMNRPKDSAVTSRNEAKEARIRTAVKQGKVIDDRKKL